MRYIWTAVTVPTAPPQNVAIQSATATQLDVTWDPPPVDAQNGDIQGYKVRVSAKCRVWHRLNMPYWLTFRVQRNNTTVFCFYH